MVTFTGMKLSRRAGITALLLLAAPAVLLAAAPPELAGDWQGKLAVDAKNSLTVRFSFTKASNGAYTALLNSPDNSAVKDTAVSGVTFDGTNLKFTVPTLQGSYAGKLANGKISGQWTQPGGPLPLELAPYKKVVLSADAMKPYIGNWTSTLTMAGTTQTLVFEFKQAAGGGLEGTFKIPDQGLTRPMTDITVENGELSLKINVGAEISFKGKLASNTIVGKLKIPSPVAPPDGADVTLKRGDYKPAPVPLKLTAEAFAKLKGKWQGKIAVTNPQNQKVELPVAVRFESNARNEYFGYLDSPAQGVSGMVVSFASLEGDKFTARVAAAQAEYIGTVAGSKITGEWVQAQAGLRTPVELTKTP